MGRGVICMQQPVSAPKLTIKRQDGSNYREIEWDKEILTIGRDSLNDLVIDHSLASRRHARLERTESGFYVRDLNSTNGTYVNEAMIEDAYQLKHQDKIIVADTIIMFHDSDATAKGEIPLHILRAVQEDVRVDSEAKAVYIHGEMLKPSLTVKEFQLLELLYHRKGQVVSKDEIARKVWDYEVFDYNAIDALIYRVRQRIEPSSNNPRYLVTQRGFGYKLITKIEE